MDSTPPQPLPQILQEPLSPVVGLLLDSRIPARIAWTATDGTPRIVPIWFSWTGSVIQISTFAGAKKLAHLSDGANLAMSIDTDDFPYRSLKIRGSVSLQPHSGVTDHYKEAATRYLGPAMAQEWLDFLGNPDQVLLSVQPEWAVLSDMAKDSPFFR